MLIIMPCYRLKGHASFEGSSHNSFEVVVNTTEPHFKNYHQKQVDAVKDVRPDWKNISVDSCTEI